MRVYNIPIPDVCVTFTPEILALCFSIVSFRLGPGTFELCICVFISIVALRGLHWKIILVHVDDIIIFGGCFQEHQIRLREVFDRLRYANLKLKPEKCVFARSSLKFLGHIVSRKGVHTDPEKTRKVVDWPTPTNVKELRAFLGLASYYRRFVEGFASIAAPLSDMTGKRRALYG